MTLSALRAQPPPRTDLSPGQQDRVFSIRPSGADYLDVALRPPLALLRSSTAHLQEETLTALKTHRQIEGQKTRRDRWTDRQGDERTDRGTVRQTEG